MTNESIGDSDRSRGADASESVAADRPNRMRGARLRRAGQLKIYGVAAVVFAMLLGMLAGAATFTFGYGKGASYLSNDPETCINCHVMQGHMDSWQHSSHHHVAVCNDCHLPHNFLGKYITKADNGFFHSLAFTLQNYHDPIRIKPRNARVAQGSCIHCHQDVVHAMLPLAGTTDMLSCVHCHKDVGHALR